MTGSWSPRRRRCRSAGTNWICRSPSMTARAPRSDPWPRRWCGRAPAVSARRCRPWRRSLPEAASISGSNRPSRWRARGTAPPRSSGSRDRRRAAWSRRSCSAGPVNARVGSTWRCAWSATARRSPITRSRSAPTCRARGVRCRSAGRATCSRRSWSGVDAGRSRVHVENGRAVAWLPVQDDAVVIMAVGSDRPAVLDLVGAIAPELCGARSMAIR